MVLNCSSGQSSIQDGDQLTASGVTDLVQSEGYWQGLTKVVLELDEQIGSDS